MNSIRSNVDLPFSLEEYEKRWASTFEHMRMRGLEAAVVWSRGGGGFDRFQEAFYLTNYYSHNSGYAYDWMQSGTRAAAHCAVILRPGHEPILVADDPTYDPRCISTSRVVSSPDVVAATAEVLHKEEISGEVGLIGMDCISAKHLQQLSTLVPDIRWEENDDLLIDVRIIKSPAELDILRGAGETVTVAMNAMFEKLFTGGTEAEAAGEAVREIYKRQGNLNFCNLSHGLDMASRFTDFPMVGYSQRRPPDGSIVRGWLSGAMSHGYWLDPGRTTVVGRSPTPDQRYLIETCAEIVEKMRAKVKPGASAREISAFGQRLRDDFHGVNSDENSWLAVFGHGNGLYWEPPVLSPKYDGKHQLFLEGMVAATEVFLDLPGVGSAGFEQNFIVTASGTELLTKTPLFWW